MGLSKYEELYSRVMNHLNNQDWESAFSLVRDGAQNGDPESTAILSEFYRHGVGVPQDLEYAIELLEKAVDMGCSEAADALGSLYMLGEEVPENQSKGLYWLNKAVEMGDTLSMSKLSTAYMYGDGVEKDYHKAFELAFKSAKDGIKGGMVNLAMLYDDGLGVVADPEQAVYWYRRCLEADPEDTLVLYRLVINLADPFEEKNVHPTHEMLEEAYSYACKGVELGDLDCHIMVGWFYEQGEVVRQDYNTSHKYIQIAADNGSEFGQNLLTRYRKNIFGNYYIP